MPQTKAPVSTSQSLCEAVAFETELGWMAVGVTNDRLSRVIFGQPTFDALMEVVSAERMQLVDQDELSDWVGDLCCRLRSFAAGESCDFADIPVDTDHLTSFGQAVVDACRALSWGETLSYAELAAKAGSPGAARAVGNVMANNRLPLVVPCHRVLGSGGHLGGYSAPGGLVTKRRLLDAEAVA
ncbi:methylated-DNA--[protein]-cysteine S-methyltransferase [Aeoliella mucimassa]|uniref:methylated-DNA--[protein]-cysteine S-methyltransferase n=1 Tax=Aeoliella mucimassa TaxID=2527972 RepID=A0A518ARD5_9BACT|nr:MGMT family protein [Aeoliella mucimassa]QDU57288.1 Methylated-DNA--protein-cysteine methyltransferase, constitutive [Aeoliella mucimassa]